MSDICMCEGNGCMQKESCYRYTAKPSEYQSYFVVPPYKCSLGECEYYWYRGKEKSTDEKQES